MRQVHSAIIHELRATDTAEMLTKPEDKPVLTGDGLITNLPGILLAAGTADCVPVLVADTKKRIVGAFHAGWRGTVAGIVEDGIARLQQNYGSKSEDLIAAIGPSIGPCCYAVGEEVRAAVASKFNYAGALFHPVSTPQPWRSAQHLHSAPEQPLARIHLDLWEANRLQLLHAGLADAQITVLNACTACSRDARGQLRFFSHRAESGNTGRMLSVVGIADEPGENHV
ncbi:MAG: peptidoglycan editing factor PgeF [Acidobacteriota bacterium]|nr:peptidoglycan editing factor PgeF [Acidobacteriota bacterium]